MNNRKRTNGRLIKFVKFALSGFNKLILQSKQAYMVQRELYAKSESTVVGYVWYKEDEAYKRSIKADLQRFESRKHKDTKYKPNTKITHIGGKPV